ncbi:MAG: (Fe-S)-binding protein [Candidatus Micrarchaeaceae archaeon]
MNEERVARLEASIRNFVFKNLMKSYLPFPLDRVKASQWAYPLNVPKGGKTILYTSYMYQFASSFKVFEKLIPTFITLGSSELSSNLGTKLIKPKSQEIARSDSILQNIYKMTSRVGDDIGYLYEDEPYSGSILYELGFMDEFKTYGSKMYELFKTKNVEQIVTVDPHTTNTLSNLKKHIQFDIPFVSYLNLVKDSQGNGEFVLHDSCLYSRFLNMHDTIREVLAKSGLKLVEDEFTTGKRFGVCCEAPVGPLGQIS